MDWKIEKILYWFPKRPVKSNMECTNTQQYVHSVAPKLKFPLFVYWKKKPALITLMHQQSHVICVQYWIYHLFCDAMGDIPHPTSHIKVEKMWSTAETVTSNLIPISCAALRNWKQTILLRIHNNVWWAAEARPFQVILLCFFFLQVQLCMCESACVLRVICCGCV